MTNLTVALLKLITLSAGASGPRNCYAVAKEGSCSKRRSFGEGFDWTFGKDRWKAKHPRRSNRNDLWLQHLDGFWFSRVSRLWVSISGQTDKSQVLPATTPRFSRLVIWNGLLCSSVFAWIASVRIFIIVIGPQRQKGGSMRSMIFDIILFQFLKPCSLGFGLSHSTLKAQVAQLP